MKHTDRIPVPADYADLAHSVIQVGNTTDLTAHWETGFQFRMMTFLPSCDTSLQH